MLTMPLALATFKAHMGLKPKFWMIIIPRPKGRGNAAFMLRNFSKIIHKFNITAIKIAILALPVSVSHCTFLQSAYKNIFRRTEFRH